MTPAHRAALSRLRAAWGRMDGRSVLVTGATRGIGLETAVRLAGLGADVLVHGRDAGRGAAALAAVRAASRPAAPPALYLADLELARRRPRPGARELRLSTAAPRRPGRQRRRVLARSGARPATASSSRSRSTSSRRVLLAAELLPPLRAAAPCAHRHPELGLALDRRDPLGRPAARRAGRLRRRSRAYDQSKLAVLMLTLALARRLEGSGVTRRVPRPRRRGHQDAGERVARPARASPSRTAP